MGAMTADELLAELNAALTEEDFTLARKITLTLENWGFAVQWRIEWD